MGPAHELSCPEAVYGCPSKACNKCALLAAAVAGSGYGGLATHRVCRAVLAACQGVLLLLLPPPPLLLLLRPA